MDINIDYNKMNKNRKKNQKRRNRKKKNRDKYLDKLASIEKEDKNINSQNDNDASPLVVGPDKSLSNDEKDLKNGCFISKFFSYPCEYKSLNENFEWDDETDDEIVATGSLEKELLGNGLFFSNLVSKKEPQRKNCCEITYSIGYFLIDSPTNDDLNNDEEIVWVETAEERELREKIQKMVVKANEDWDAISISSDHNDKDTIFQMEIKSNNKNTRRVRFDEKPTVWIIPNDHNDKDTIFQMEIKSNNKNTRRVRFDEKPTVWIIPNDQND